MAKVTDKIDTRNPFIPSTSPICRMADTALIFGVAAAGLLAVLVSLAMQVVRFWY